MTLRIFLQTRYYPQNPTCSEQALAGNARESDFMAHRPVARVKPSRRWYPTIQVPLLSSQSLIQSYQGEEKRSQIEGTGILS